MKDFVVTEQPGYIASQRCNVKPPNSRAQKLTTYSGRLTAEYVLVFCARLLFSPAQLGCTIRILLPLFEKSFEKCFVFTRRFVTKGE